MTQSDYRSLPSVDAVLSHPTTRELVKTYSHQALADLARDQLTDARKAIGAGGTCPSLETVVDTIYNKAVERWQLRPSKVINATGVIIHTNMGRAPLSVEACRAMQLAAEGYSDLELDMRSGERGSRSGTIETMVCQLTGAEAALPVNNNASALLLTLNEMAQNREVVVSRGEAVEIGGGFRIPDVLKASGADLVEVGTTNRTYVSDYENAITDRTAAFLSVHTSNFKVVGFTESPSLGELVELGERHGVPVLHDVGSGCLLDTTRFGLSPEPTPQQGIDAGVDLVLFSTDKLLGGPQAGIVAGKKKLVDRIRKHPIARAVRCDKLTLASLSATLLHYVREEALEKVPVWRMISMPLEEIEARAGKWAEGIKGARVVEGFSTIGGGSLPGDTLPTKVVAVTPKRGHAVNELAKKLRTGETPVMGRIEDDLLLLDPRTVMPDEDEALSRVLGQALA